MTIDDGVPDCTEISVDIPLSRLKLCVRSRNALSAAGIRTMRQLVRSVEIDLLRLRNFSTVSLLEVETALMKLGLQLGMDVPEQRIDSPPTPSLRDRFAEAALRGICGNSDVDMEHEDYADWCWRQADAMLAQRNHVPDAEKKVGEG